MGYGAAVRLSGPLTIAFDNRVEAQVRLDRPDPAKSNAWDGVCYDESDRPRIKAVMGDIMRLEMMQLELKIDRTSERRHYTQEQQLRQEDLQSLPKVEWTASTRPEFDALGIEEF